MTTPIKKARCKWNFEMVISISRGKSEEENPAEDLLYLLGLIGEDLVDLQLDVQEKSNYEGDDKVLSILRSLDKSIKEIIKRHGQQEKT
jgi:hypothetical protein